MTLVQGKETSVFKKAFDEDYPWDCVSLISYSRSWDFAFINFKDLLDFCTIVSEFILKYSKIPAMLTNVPKSKILYIFRNFFNKYYRTKAF